MKNVVYIDVDDTLIRGFGSKSIPMTHVIELVKQLKVAGAELYCWSRAGRGHAKSVAEQLGIADCFTAFMTKPDLMIDDRVLKDLGIKETHPNECHGVSAQEMLKTLNKK